ncbi:retron St85 family RNA-directed DNA polymerase [Thorsellia anophelis]|uniref:RNA-directed DNA polymerase n=1 Tax=Thorsellia anophelis DSM 18579 TaxID=1123402 RepID=A0A1I0CYS4_9GAMM|nr:retron St85 family RNA-directed DNA polymerase [Thorsellia anophelis]SET24273.1 Retron-type reverse transcriptase [Thorsellia anophelis DSM 18579]
MNIEKYLSENLSINISALHSFSRTAPHRYKVYSIPKRNSKGERIIAHPSKELKFIQKMIIKKLTDILPLHESVISYRKKKSIVNNVIPHLNSSFLLKIDLKDFFPSIEPDLFFEQCKLLDIHFSDNDKKLLTGFLFWRNRKSSKLQLSIGAPSSPLISNFILYRFDDRITKLCASYNVNYTRYADDLSFSTISNSILLKLSEEISAMLQEIFQGRFLINHEKTIFSSKASNRHITGITITNSGEMSLGRNFKRNISACIHKFTLNQLPQEELLKLKGHLSFFKHVEPYFILRMESKYGKHILDKIRKSQ